MISPNFYENIDDFDYYFSISHYLLFVELSYTKIIYVKEIKIKVIFFLTNESYEKT